MRRRADPRQLLLDWNAVAPVVVPVSVPEPPRAIPEEVAQPESPLLQVLPWDFSITFPPVMQDAIDAGVLEEDDAEPEGLAALHADYGRELLAALCELDSVQDARRRGVNPATGKTPRTQATKQKLAEKLDREVERLERWWATLLETYEAAFGPKAFGHCIRARHAGVEIMAMAHCRRQAMFHESPTLHPR